MNRKESGSLLGLVNIQLQDEVKSVSEIGLEICVEIMSRLGECGEETGSRLCEGESRVGPESEV